MTYPAERDRTTAERVHAQCQARRLIDWQNIQIVKIVRNDLQTYLTWTFPVQFKTSGLDAAAAIPVHADHVFHLPQSLENRLDLVYALDFQRGSDDSLLQGSIGVGRDRCHIDTGVGNHRRHVTQQPGSIMRHDDDGRQVVLLLDLQPVDLEHSLQLLAAIAAQRAAIVGMHDDALVWVEQPYNRISR